MKVSGLPIDTENHTEEVLDMVPNVKLTGRRGAVECDGKNKNAV